ncbi:MAG: helix-turn-helix domain-containing protein [Acetatifactor sp.]|nr:helix-turn-helix domain-containing protein [Acetatifactor sp.]
MDNLALLNLALCYMEENLSENISTEDVARACYCSPSSLQKLFRRLAHYSIKEYIIKRRLTLAARDLRDRPSDSILDIALRYCYQSNEAFTRAFEAMWNCSPSAYRQERSFADLCPRLILSGEYVYGDDYMNRKKSVDISELYDLFKERKNCYFVCCDIQYLTHINEISRKAGDLAIAETAYRMEQCCGAEDLVFRIGGDEFAMLTVSEDAIYAQQIADRILAMNDQTFVYEDQGIPVRLYADITCFGEKILRYNELFAALHQTINESKK